MLQPDLTCGDRAAHCCHHEEKTTVHARAAARRTMDRGDGEHDHHVEKSDPLQHAQRTRLLLLDVLEIEGEREQSTTDEEAERVAEARGHVQLHPSVQCAKMFCASVDLF